MEITQLTPAYTRVQTAATNPAPSNPPEPRDSVVVDRSGGMAAGVIGLVMSAGASSFVKFGFSPVLAYGCDAFIGASTGAQMAEAMGKNKGAGLAIGAGIGLAVAAAGIHFGWPGALGSALVLGVARGVVLPTMLNRGH